MPTMIEHYVAVDRYRPPDGLLAALETYRHSDLHYGTGLLDGVANSPPRVRRRPIPWRARTGGVGWLYSR